MNKLTQASKSLTQDLQRLEAEIKQIEVNNVVLTKMWNLLNKKVRELERNATASQQALVIARKVVTDLQSQAQQHVADVVTRCLQSIYGKSYSFAFQFTQQKNRTVCRLTVLNNGMELDPMTEVGGGIADVVAFALRIAVLVARKPQLRRVLILDEPFRFVSSQYREAVGQLIETLATEAGIQFVFVTHISELELGHVQRL